MQVTIDHNHFFIDQNYDCLDKIFDFFKSKRHIWLNIDLETIEQSKWFEGLGNRDKRDLKELFVRSTRPSLNSKIISIQQIEQDDFNIEEAYFYLNQPLSLVVENYEYEPAFINCIFRNFGKELLEAKNKHWLKFENGAGANDNTIKGMLKELFNDAIFTKSKEKYLNCYIIKDSDREYCTLDSNGMITKQKLPEHKTNFLKANKIPFHILHKREKENYMPDTVFNSFLQTARRNDPKKQFSKLYLNLTPHQKDYFDLEKGFVVPKSNPRQVKERANLINEVRNLYSNLTNEQYRKIGFGLPFPNFKSEFSKNFDYVTKEDLEKRIKHQPKLTSKVNPKDTTERNEFDHIIHEIKYLL